MTLTPHDLFYTQTGLDRDSLTGFLRDTLARSDDGELYLEYGQSEAFAFDDGRLKSASYDTVQGFGLRAVQGEAVAFGQASELSMDAIRRAAAALGPVQALHPKGGGAPPARTNARLYTSDNPLTAVPFEEKVRLLEEIETYARGLDPRVRQVSASLAGSWRAIEILRADGGVHSDMRPLVRLNVSLVAGDGERQETGSHGVGGRELYGRFLAPDAWKAQVDEAWRQALVNLESVPAPAGEMTVVLGPGWPGILLHEAIGHGLEGDFNRKKQSAFWNLLGQRVAAPGVTVIDDGTLPDRRGSLTIDDEGTPTSRTVLIEDGFLRGYLQDRLNARLMGVAPTGNGRRESFAHAPMPRMTNTYMLAGPHDPGEIIASVRKGLYAVSFGGGQVDIVSGKFVFSCTEAYLIENGRIGPPVKGATLIGNGPDVLTKVEMVGNDLALDPGIGTCGKAGQGVPVGVGQPTLKIGGLTVGGTAA
ncbi:MAG: metalloprotease TldD [Alphaproteobacteria bacterium]|nr:metalloprotease TldD [Alphaproteobacteria bacterium]